MLREVSSEFCAQVTILSVIGLAKMRQSAGVWSVLGLSRASDTSQWARRVGDNIVIVDSDSKLS